MTQQDPDEFARRLVRESPDTTDPTGWFDRLYAAANAGETRIPWDRGAPHPLLVEWAEASGVRGPGRALVVGCGLGFDSEYVAGVGFETTAFDVSPTAVETTRRRYPDSVVRYEVADVLDLPATWDSNFDLVVECLTVQSLPERVRGAAIDGIARLVAPGGALLVVAAAREDGEPADGPPWPLIRGDIDRFADARLHAVRIEQPASPDNPGLMRWRAEFGRSR